MNGKFDKQELEANEFAMALLMPAKLVKRWIRANGPLDFAVPITAAAMRLKRLGFLGRG